MGWSILWFKLDNAKPNISSITFDIPKSISALAEQQKCKEWSGEFYLRSDSLEITYFDEAKGKKAIMKCIKTTRQVMNYGIWNGTSTPNAQRVETETTETLFDYDLTL